MYCNKFVTFASYNTPFISKPVQLRILDAIMEDFRSIEHDTDGLLDEIMK